MSTSPRFRSTALEQAEAVLVEQYPRLVRLAYLTLPDSLGRHSRVLLAHRAVQRALPRSGAGGERGGPGGPDSPGGPLAEVRVRVLRGCLAPAGRAGTALARAGWPPLPPFVWGLRLWPPAGGIEEAARALADEPAPVRAAFVLHRMDGLPEEAAARLLGAAGVPAPADVMGEALAVRVGETLLRELGRPEFDASVVSTRPTDLLRRRRRMRAGWAAAAALAVVAGVLVADGPPEPYASRPAGGSAGAGALDPGRLQRVPAQAWADTARVDFTAWPARGARAEDRALLARALGTWSSVAARGPVPSSAPGSSASAGSPSAPAASAGSPSAPGSSASAAQNPYAQAPYAQVQRGGVRVGVAPGTAADLPARPPQLLYAGDSEGRTVVLLLDGERVVRYAEATGGQRGRELEFARTDEAGVTTAAALTLVRGSGGTRARYLLAPWIAAAGTRDLLRAGDGTRPLAFAADGVTEPVPVPPAEGACGAWPVLEVTSSARIVEKHSFVLADLGALTPVHLTYTPLPDGPGAVAARQPREATGPAARAAWAPIACRLWEMRGGGVRAVNVWEFAASELPDGGGRGVWSCTRASSWEGPGDVLVRLSPPSGPPQDVARARATAACGRFGQHLLAGTRWRSPAGRWYQLAAGSREVTGITATGAVGAEAAGRTLTAPAGPEGAAVSLTGRLAGGGRVTALDGEGGGRD
ncbi:hypothetical protein ACWGFX_05090 [Streptomyces xanthophaeus]